METREERKKRYLATAMSFVYFLIQTVNLVICIQQYAKNDKIGYFISIMIITLIDKIVSYFVLKKEKFGYEILILDMLNLGFISIFLKRYPHFYRPMYGAKLFFIIIPTIALQMIFFFALDMIDETQDREIQILMIVAYVGYQLLQVRCFLAMRIEQNHTIKQFLQMLIIYTLNIFSNYGIWLVFSSHKDSYFEINLIFYGAVLFLAMVVYQSHKLFLLKDSTFLLNFLYNIITSTNYTTEYSYYFNLYESHIEDLYRERQNDLMIMSGYKSLQLIIYFILGDIKAVQDKYQFLSQMSNAMVIITFLDIVSNVFQYFFGVRTIFKQIKTTKLTSPLSISKAIMEIDKSKKYIYIDNRLNYDQPHHEDNEYEDHGQQIVEMNMLQSLSSSDNRELKVNSELDNDLAQRFLKHLTLLQKDHGYVFVEYPQLCVSSQKFDVSNYVNYAQLTKFFYTSDSIPSNPFGLHADWENIYMYRLMTRGFDKKYKNPHEKYKYCVETYLDMFLPMLILYKYYAPVIKQKPHQIIIDIYSD